MLGKKSQAATEFIVFFSIVLVILIIVIIVSSPIQKGIGENQVKAAKAKLASQELAVNNYAIDDETITLIFVNNYQDDVILQSVTVNGVQLSSSSIPKLLKPFRKITITSSSFSTTNGSKWYDYPINYTYKRLDTGAIVESENDLHLVGFSAGTQPAPTPSSPAFSGLYVDTCQELNESNTTYRMNASINTTEACFNFSGANTILDCDDYTIVYGAANITLSAVTMGSNTTIQNCNIQDDSASGGLKHGINTAFASDVLISNINITIISPFSDGIEVGGIGTETNITINNVIINSSSSDSKGIDVGLASGLVVNNSVIEVSANEEAIEISSDFGVYENLRLKGGTTRTVSIGSGGNNTFINNSISGGQHGIQIQNNVNDNTFIGNNITVDSIAFVIQSAVGNNFSNNYACGGSGWSCTSGPLANIDDGNYYDSADSDCTDDWLGASIGACT